jgi:hypothetical protein
MLAVAVAGIVAGLLWSGAAQADLIVNGGFETGDFTGWSISDPNGTAIDNADPFAGAFDAALGSGGGDGTLVQTLSTVPGVTYTITFELQNQDSTLGQIPGFTDFFSLAFGNSQLFSSDGILPGPGYNTFAFNVTATAPRTLLSFTEENDLSVWNLDSVSVQPVVTRIPEPSSALPLLVGAGCLFAFARRRLGQRAGQNQQGAPRFEHGTPG